MNIGNVTTYTALDALNEGSHAFEVKAVDNSGNQGTAAMLNFVCVSPDTTAPVISGVASTSITTSGATVSWTTNEAATSQVEYGQTTSYGSSTTLDPNLVTSHSVNLSGLTANTTYHYRVISKDSSGNSATSGDFSLTTFNTVALATSVTTTALSNTTIALGGNVTDAATITTSTGPGATGTVDFQVSTDGGSTWTDFGSAVALVGGSATSISYTPATAGTYYFRAVYSGDSNYRNSQSGNTEESLTVTSTSTTQLVVRYIDVGQGDAILIDYGTYEMLIDGGPGPTDVASYIKPYVDGPLDVVVATHPDADHIGGLIAVLNSFTIGQVWTDGQATTTQTYTRFTSAVQTNGAQVHTGRRGDTIDLGGLTFHVLNPTGINGTTNNDSIVLELDFGQVDFLFEGDAEQEAEASMIAAGLIHHVDVVKIGHHGSDTASSAAFVAATSPEVAIYCCGLGNQYGHLAASTVAKWRNVGAAVYGTDVNGTVTVTTNGATFTVSTTK